MINFKITLLFLFITSIAFTQIKYFVSKDGSGNFSNISQVNSASLNSGDIVAFQGGETFADAVLECKKGVTYTSFGNGRAAIGDRVTTISKNTTVKVDAKNVIIDNLIINGYKEADNVIKFSQGNITITNCELIGGLNFHKKWTFGIYQENHSASGGENISIQRNKINGFGGAAISISRPFNVDIGYNEIYDLWRENATANVGATAITRSSFTDGNNPEDVWDCAYTVKIHHNNIHHFDYGVFPGYSRIILEYNEIHHNLDERIYFGGVKHGDIGKLGDIGGKFGSLGLIFRYNYIHDLFVYGEPNFTYDTATEWHRTNGTPNVVNKNNGTGRPVYLNAGDGAYGANFGDDTGEAPEALIGAQGYGNFWIHNNIFYNCSKGIIDRGANSYDGVQAPYDVTKTSYLINNTVINCGTSSYATSFVGLVYLHATGQSPQKTVNNILHFSTQDASFAIRYWEKDSYLGYNIYLNQSGVTTEIPPKGSNYATLLEYSAVSRTKIENEQYLVNQSKIWNDTSSSIFASNIGVSGAYIPDVRLIPNGAAHNKGKEYNTLGDNYNVKATYWNQTHTLGEDPAGRSFSYDILGNFRESNDIGAVGVVGEETGSHVNGLKLILQGSWKGERMVTSLSLSKLFPLQQPYNINPWNFSYDASINSLQTDYVDWLLIELRSNPSDIKYSKTAILTEDGTVINPDASPFCFTNISKGDYYIAVKHRNHLAMMSSRKISVEADKQINYDFTDSQEKAYGIKAMVELGNGLYGMISGDGDANGVIDVLDYGTVANSILSVGYAQGDFDMNGVMNVLDYSFISQNILRISNLP